MLKLDFNLLFNIINLLILCVLLKKFLLKPVLNVMKKREDMINQSLENARASHHQADTLKKEYDEKLANAQNEAKNILETSKKNADLQYNKTLAQANHEAQKIIEDAHKTAKLEQAKALREAKSQIIELACDMATKLAIKNSDSADDKSAYDKFIEEAGDSDDIK